MAKGIGLIGNFKGKVGNMVGYQLSDSNTGNTQGIRVYQPNVKNPKTAAQAEQRAKLAPINATYRALKMIIDRGNEGLPYGNKSRLAWLKQAFASTKMPWYVKGAQVAMPVGCPLTKGSLSTLNFSVAGDSVSISVDAAQKTSPVATVKAISQLLKAQYPFLKNEDQVSIVCTTGSMNSLVSQVVSFQIDLEAEVAISGFTADAGQIIFEPQLGCSAAAIIISRQGANGEHLRSNSSLVLVEGSDQEPPYDRDSKKAAIESYMASDSVNSDWAEESIQ